MIFHLLSGISHLYLYLNECTDSTEDVLRPFEDAGFVTLIRQSGGSQQKYAYTKCLATVKREKKYFWTVFFDVDEFLFVKEKNVCLGSFLSQYREHGALVVPWRNFGLGTRLLAKVYKIASPCHRFLFLLELFQNYHVPKKFAYMCVYPAML